MFQHDQIKVAVRLRPVLPPSEHDVAWSVQNNGNSIVSMVAGEFDRDSVTDSASISNPFRVANFGANIRERELKRRLNEIQKEQEFHFD
jgi:Kinesin motor domain